MRIVALVLALLLITPVAHAGNWAVTYVDPLPTVETGRSYTVGYWVLQHGNHAYAGDLGSTGLKFTRDGDSYFFPGVRMRERAHYAAAVHLPAGNWQVYGVQGVFADHQIGTLTVPGTLQIAPVKDVPPLPDAAKTWGDIRPPTEAVVKVEPAAVSVETPAERPVWIVGVVLLGAGVLWFLLRHRLRRT